MRSTAISAMELVRYGGLKQQKFSGNTDDISKMTQIDSLCIP